MRANEVRDGRNERAQSAPACPCLRPPPVHSVDERPGERLNVLVHLGVLYACAVIARWAAGGALQAGAPGKFGEVMQFVLPTTSSNREGENRSVAVQVPGVGPMAAARFRDCDEGRTPVGRDTTLWDVDAGRRA